MSETMETDAIVNALNASNRTDGDDMFVMEQHARKLERQRDELRAALSELLDAESELFPAAEFGREAQDAWAERRYNAREQARTALSKSGAA